MSDKELYSDIKLTFSSTPIVLGTVIFIFLLNASMDVYAQKWRLNAGYTVQKFGVKFDKNPSFSGEKESTIKGVLQLELERYYSDLFYISATGDYLIQNQSDIIFGGPVDFNHASVGGRLGLRSRNWGLFAGGKVGKIWDFRFKAVDTNDNALQVPVIGEDDKWVPSVDVGLKWYPFKFLRLEATFSHAFSLPDPFIPASQPGNTTVLNSAEIKNWSFRGGISISIPWGKRSDRSNTNGSFSKGSDEERTPDEKGTTKASGITFSSPLGGMAIVTSPYGMRGAYMHDGVDIDAEKGDPIYAVADGQVIQARKTDGGYGKVVKIKHKNGFVSMYAHLGMIKARTGTNVKRGDVIGRAGSSGRSTGVHLHFEIRKDDKAVDPSKYLEF